jgi:hypothetical protein
MAKTYEEVWATADDAYKARFGGDKAKAIQAMKDWNKKKYGTTEPTKAGYDTSTGKKKATAPVSPQSGNRAVGASSSISSLTSPSSLKTDLDAALSKKFGKNSDVTQRITSGMSLRAGGDGKSSSTTGQQYQSSTSHRDASGTLITNLKGIPGKTMDRSIIGGDSSTHSAASASAGKAGDWKSSSQDMDTTDYAAKLMKDEMDLNAKMMAQKKRDTIAGLGSKKEFRQAKREGILTGKDKKAAKQAIAQTKGDIAFAKSQDAANNPMTVRQAKKQVRQGVTPDELGAKGLGYGAKYEKVVGSRAYAKQIAQKEGTSVKKSAKNFVTDYNKQQEAANNPGRLKVGMFGKIKEA